MRRVIQPSFFITSHFISFPADASPIGPLLEPTLALYCPIGKHFTECVCVLQDLLGVCRGRRVCHRCNCPRASPSYKCRGPCAGCCAVGSRRMGYIWQRSVHAIHLVERSITSSVAANSLQLSRNPLHFSSSSSAGSRPFSADEEDDEPEPSSSYPPQMTFALLGPQAGRSLLSTPSRRNGPASKLQLFFEAIVNTASPDAPPEQNAARPRLVYIRGN